MRNPDLRENISDRDAIKVYNQHSNGARAYQALMSIPREKPKEEKPVAFQKESITTDFTELAVYLGAE